jgi:lysophospholipase L1-like esterase
MKKIAIWLLVTVAIFCAVPFAFAQENEHDGLQTVHYVALGDSIAAGHTPYGTVDRSYADYLKDYLERYQNQVVEYHNFAVTGYTSEQLKNDILNNESVRQQIREATIVTIDIGANDLFRKLLTDPAKASEGITAASLNLQTILRTIDELNPNVEVYVMGYYNPFAYYPEQVQAFLVPLNESLNTEIEACAEANGDSFVPTGERIDKHYEKYMPNPEDNHLNLEGYKVIAQEFWRAILTRG